MARALWIWLGLSVLGIILIALLPEDWLGGAILFRLSERHGPSMADTIGLSLAFAGWAIFIHALWGRRGELEPRWLAWLLAVVATAALCGCIAAFSANREVWGLVFGSAALAAQLALARLAQPAPQ